MNIYPSREDIVNINDSVMLSTITPVMHQFYIKNRKHWWFFDIMFAEMKKRKAKQKFSDSHGIECSPSVSWDPQTKSWKKLNIFLVSNGIANKCKVLFFKRPQGQSWCYDFLPATSKAFSSFIKVSVLEDFPQGSFGFGICCVISNGRESARFLNHMDQSRF